MPAKPADPSRRTDNLKLAILAALQGIFAAAILSQARFLNGPWYWKWPYRPLEPLRFLPPLLLCAASLAAAIALWARRRQSRVVAAAAILLLMTHMLAMELVYGSLRHPLGFSYTTYII